MMNTPIFLSDAGLVFSIVGVLILFYYGPPPPVMLRVDVVGSDAG